MVQAVLSEAGLRVADLDALAFGRGPGSFTGLRIAAGIVQGLALGSDLPVIGVSCLNSLALQSFDRNGVVHQLALIDARMDEVYWSLCEVVPTCAAPVVRSLGGEHVSAPERVQLDDLAPALPLAACGSGLRMEQRLSAGLRDRLTLRVADIEPDARAMSRLAVADFVAGRLLAPEQALPTYIRDEVTWQKLPGR
jgi:tRNA threonylcarbamoyladenosine biosynthesis protein TsaB